MGGIKGQPAIWRARSLSMCINLLAGLATAVACAGCGPMGEGNCADSIKSADEARTYFVAFFDKESPARESLIDDLMAKSQNLKARHRPLVLEGMKAMAREDRIQLSEDDAGGRGWNIATIAGDDGIRLFLRCSRIVEIGWTIKRIHSGP